MGNYKKIISFISIVFTVAILFPSNSTAGNKDTTALKRRLIISVGYGDPAVIYFQNWYNNTFKNKSDQKVVPQINPIYAKIEYRILKHMGIGIDVSYDDYEAKQAPPSSTNYTTAYKGYTFVADIRLNRHVHLIRQRLDLYWGVGLGYQVQSIENIIATKSLPKLGSTPIAFEFTFGGRFYITKRIGIYIEGGIARSIIQGGLCVRL
jgi:hypothetical protein